MATLKVEAKSSNGPLEYGLKQNHKMVDGWLSASEFLNVEPGEYTVHLRDKTTVEPFVSVTVGEQQPDPIPDPDPKPDPEPDPTPDPVPEGKWYEPRNSVLFEKHPWQIALGNYMAGFNESDFRVNLEEITVKKSYFKSAEDAYQTWLFLGRRYNEFMEFGGLRVAPQHFTMNKIEANGQINMTVGKSQFMLAIPTAFYADWDYKGNPYYNNRALKLRAFVAASIDLIMQDEEHERGKNDRSDFVGIQLIRWAYPYGVIKDELPQEIRTAYEQGLIRMFERLEDWGTTGIHADMDMGALVGMMMTAKYVDSQDLQQRAEDHVDMILEKHLYDAGYIDHGSAYDAGYNGISAYFINFAAQFSNYQPLIDAIKKMGTLKAYMTLPDPDGRKFSPFHSNPSSDGDAPHDYWNSYNREVGLARFSDDSGYLAMDGAFGNLDKMVDGIESSLRFLHHPDAGELLKPLDKSPGKWKSENWIDGQSLNATAQYLQGDLYDRMQSLQNSKYKDSPFERNEQFTKSLGGKMLSVKRKDYGAIINNDRLSWWTKEGQTSTINGFGGGCLSAFWTEETGSVILGGTRTAHFDGLDLDQWEVWPVHAVSGKASNGKVFSSGIQRYPKATYDLPRVTLSGSLSDIYADPTKSLGGDAEYSRIFDIKDNGVEITTSVEENGSNISSLYEVLPVYLRHGRMQKNENPTRIEFEVNGNWKSATNRFSRITGVRLERFSGVVYVEFSKPVRAKISDIFYQDKPGGTKGMNAQNILFDLKDAGNSITYGLRSSKSESFNL